MPVATSSSTFVNLDDVKDGLNIPQEDVSHDAEIQRFIDAATVQIVDWVGPVVPTVYTNEVHEEAAGKDLVVLFNPPIISVETVYEYVGPMQRELTAQPLGSSGYDNFGYSLDVPESGVLRRRLGSGTLGAFWGPVVVSYTAGLTTVPANVYLAALEDVRGLYQQTQQGGRPAFGSSGAEDDTWNVGPMHLFPRLAALLGSQARVTSIA